MSQQNIKQPPLTPKREREATKARDEMMRRAKEQGIKPFDFDDALGEGADGQTQEEIQQEVDEFLEMLREWRSGSTRSID